MNRSAPKHAESEVGEFCRIDARLHTRVLFHLWTGGHGDSHVESLAKRESFTRAQFVEHPVLAVKIKPLLAISTENICLRLPKGLRRPLSRDDHRTCIAFRWITDALVHAAWHEVAVPKRFGHQAKLAASNRHILYNKRRFCDRPLRHQVWPGGEPEGAGDEVGPPLEGSAPEQLYFVFDFASPILPRLLATM